MIAMLCAIRAFSACGWTDAVCGLFAPLAQLAGSIAAGLLTCSGYISRPSYIKSRIAGWNS